jgi:hypothetical protein
LGVSELRSVDWLGQKEPLPRPTSAFSAKACQGLRMSGKRANATAITINAPVKTRRGPSRSESAPPTNPETRPAAELDATTRPAMPSEIPRTLCR